METIYILIYILICLAIAYFVGMNKRIDFGYSFLFSFLFTPIFGWIISLLSEKIKVKKPLDKILKYSGGFLFYTAIIVLVSLLFTFYKEYKSSEINRDVFDSIKIKKEFHKENLSKIVYSKGFYLAELKSGKFDIVHDSVLYKSYIVPLHQKEIMDEIIQSNKSLDDLETNIKQRIQQEKDVSKQLQKYKYLLKKYKEDVATMKSLQSVRNSQYKSYKVEIPSWWYFHSNRNMVKIFIFLLYLSLVGRFMMDIGNRKI